MSSAKASTPWNWKANDKEPINYTGLLLRYAYIWPFFNLMAIFSGSPFLLTFFFSNLHKFFTRPTDCRKNPWENTAIQGINWQWPNVVERNTINSGRCCQYKIVKNHFSVIMPIHQYVCEMKNVHFWGILTNSVSHNK